MRTNPPLSMCCAMAFVDDLSLRCLQDPGFAALLRRADNLATEYLCWETLAAFEVDLTCADERRAFALIAAAIGRSTQRHNGNLLLGQAICALGGSRGSEQVKAHLRRLLACDDLKEVCQILRPLLLLIQSRVSLSLDYAALLMDLTDFPSSGEGVRARWAQQFYSKVEVQ
ncbi:type I-E CRISPR-associated protein Cse2/CasB [Aeromonas enteropelogenes]|uniref:type I-E CRISPR-associated protein Cse2/CasB n=1 Tax=Aeromonas enteropelogenes TaxID=29489 RepID=UPI003BA3770D